MSVTIGDTTFDRVSYDADGDVLYLHVGDARSATDFDASAENHHVRFDAEGRLVGITILNAKWLLEREGKVTITLPGGASHLSAGPEALAPALASPAA